MGRKKGLKKGVAFDFKPIREPRLLEGHAMLEVNEAVQNGEEGD